MWPRSPGSSPSARIGRNMSEAHGWIWSIGALICLLAMNLTARRSIPLTSLLLAGFGLLIGMAMAPLLTYLRGHRPGRTLAGRWGHRAVHRRLRGRRYAVRRDLTFLAVWLSSPAGPDRVGIVLIFVRIPQGTLIYAVIGLVIFAALTMFDFQRLRRPRTSPRRPSWPPRSPRHLERLLFFLRSSASTGSPPRAGQRRGRPDPGPAGRGRSPPWSMPGHVSVSGRGHRTRAPVPVSPTRPGRRPTARARPG